jgi:iron complex transport system substrate-binding protein
MKTRITRSRWRTAAVVAGLAAAALALSGCSSATPAGSTSSAKWSYTDDLGKTVTLDKAPTRIVGLNEVAVSLMQYGIKPVAIYGSQNITTDPRFATFDLKGITQLGTSYGEINLEKLAAEKPDLIVADVYPTDAKGTIDKTQPDFGFNDLAQQKQIEKIAPIVTIEMGGDGADVIKSVTKLSSALGASSSKIAAAKKTYDAASAKLQTAAEESKLKVVVAYADSDGYDTVKSEDDPELRLYSDLGVDFIKPTPSGYYWGLYSWENAGKAGGDLILLSQYGYQKTELLKQATIAATPAAKADQIHPWVSAGLDYVSQASYMKQLAGYLAESKVVTD